MSPRSSGLRVGAGTADQAVVRRHNLALVLEHLRLHGSRSRARVAAETGLNKATVSSLVSELLGRGLVTEGAVERGGVGRPGLVIDLDGSTYAAIGAEVNIDYLSVIVSSLRGDVVAEQRVPFDTAASDPRDALERLAGLVRDALATAGPAAPVGLTVAVPGIVESATGRLVKAVNLGWRDTPVVDLLVELLGGPGYPVVLDNEANLAALAEIEARGGAAGRDLLLLTGGVGVGGGIVAAGHLLRGARGFAGEIGHLQVDRNGLDCGCGRRGCWETVAGLGALLRRAADEGDPVRDPNVDLLGRLGEVRRRAEDGDQRTLAAIDATATWLVSGAASLVNVFNPDVVVLGGYFAVLSRWYVPRLQQGLAEQVHAPDAGGCRVEVSTLGFAAAMRGAAHQAALAVLEDPVALPFLDATDESAGVPT